MAELDTFLDSMRPASMDHITILLHSILPHWARYFLYGFSLPGPFHSKWVAFLSLKLQLLQVTTFLVRF